MFVAENVAKKYGLTRLEQDTFAFESQSKTKVALDEGHFTEEIIPVSVAGRRGPPTLVNLSEGIFMLTLEFRCTTGELIV